MSVLISTDPPVTPAPPARSLGHRAPLLHLALPYFAGLAAGHAAGSTPAGLLLAAALGLATAALLFSARPAAGALLRHLALGTAGANPAHPAARLRNNMDVIIVAANDQ